jgi:Cytochrome c7 and related cytochrome c
MPAPQPIPFNHDLHVGGLGIDCRYCHSSVERAAAAGLPSAETCMTCHSQVWTAAAVFAPIQRSLEQDQPLAWNVLHALPEFAYFHHGVHVANGVACETCHGRIDLMPRTVKTETLSMGWCLDCHRDPAPQLRPPEAIFAMAGTRRRGPAALSSRGATGSRSSS